MVFSQRIQFLSWGVAQEERSFWLHHFIRCRAVGVDYQPTFIRRAKRIKDWLHLDHICFLLEDMLETNYRRATVLYLYGTCLEDKTIMKLIENFKNLKRGNKGDHSELSTERIFR